MRSSVRRSEKSVGGGEGRKKRHERKIIGVGGKKESESESESGIVNENEIEDGTGYVTEITEIPLTTAVDTLMNGRIRMQLHPKTRAPVMVHHLMRKLWTTLRWSCF